MSSKARILIIAMTVSLAVGLAHSAMTHADVTGSYGTHISLHSILGSETEIQPLEFDVQNELNLTVTISGLSTTIHSHFGLAGVEDVQWTYAATLGALDITGTAVFGRFLGWCEQSSPFGGGLVDAPGCLDEVRNNPVPVSDSLLFVKKRVKTSIALGGVTFENLAIFEDTNFRTDFSTEMGFEPDPEAGSEQAFAFGDVLSLNGQTPSGVTVEGKTGICAEAAPNVIKKHSWPYRVNEHCAQRVVTDVELADFSVTEALLNTGVVEAAGLQRDRFDIESGAETLAPEDPFAPNPVVTANAEVDVSESSRSCSPRDPGSGVGGICDLALSLTNNGPEDAFVNFALFGEASQPEITNIQCGTATSSNNNQTVRLASGDSVTCSWTAEFDETQAGDDFVTSVQIVSDPDRASEAISDINLMLDVTKSEKPGLFFDFETLRVSGVPLAAGVTADATLFCYQDSPCLLRNTLNVSGMGPVPVTFSFDILDVTRFAFNGFELTLSSGIGTFTITDTDGDVDIDRINAIVDVTLNPDTNPASVIMDAVILPDLGLTDFSAELAVNRGGFTFGAAVDFDSAGAGVATFDTITFSAATTIGLADIKSEATFTENGFEGSDTTFTFAF